MFTTRPELRGTFGMVASTPVTVLLAAVYGAYFGAGLGVLLLGLLGVYGVVVAVALLRG